MLLDEGWEVASTPPGACQGPGGLAGLTWAPAKVPGTAAGAVGADGRDFDSEDWWFRVVFAAAPVDPGERVVLELGGIATVSEVYLGGERIIESDSMWAAHRLDVTERVRAENELVIACRALKPLLAHRRRPAARWRTRVVNEGNLRWYRTMMFGRSPGFAPGPAPVGPWRPVRLHRHAGAHLLALSLRTALDGDAGVLTVRARVCAEAAVEVTLGAERLRLAGLGDGWYAGALRTADVRRWWPHTHGDPTLYDVTVELDGVPAARRRVGFRGLTWGSDIGRDGLDLHVNGVPVFARGAVWTPADLVTMAPAGHELRRVLELARDAGMNMLRVVGTGAYESPAFHDICDELGILVWQDLMFANLDYPVADLEFASRVEREAAAILEELAGRPSFAVLCGNSEVEQQPAMLGLDPALGADQLWDERLPEIVAEAGAGVAYVPSTPSGGDLPFHANRGIAHYFGVSGYLRPPSDARRADVRFASECLAFANVPDVVEVPVHHPRWKAGVPRDAGSGWDLGAGWDFDDVRDHYVRLLFDVDPVGLRRFDHARYLELSRAASGEVMAEVMGEWRREGSPCRGALVLWLKDMAPGAGLGVLDERGAPKTAYYHLRRALAPVAVWTTDEDVNGVAVHVANDRGEPLTARLRVSLYQDLERLVDEAQETVQLPPHGYLGRSVEGMIGRFVDAAWAYRFGPPAHDAIFATLEAGDADAPALLSQAVRFPAGRPRTVETAAGLGLEAAVYQLTGHHPSLVLRSRRLVYGLRLHLPGYRPDDDAFCLEPGHDRVIALEPTASPPGPGHLTALNLSGQLRVEASRR